MVSGQYDTHHVGLYTVGLSCGLCGASFERKPRFLSGFYRALLGRDRVSLGLKGLTTGTPQGPK